MVVNDLSTGGQCDPQEQMAELDDESEPKAGVDLALLILPAIDRPKALSDGPSNGAQSRVAQVKRGVQFEVWEKWKKKQRKLGTLTISVGGLRWWPHKGK